MAKTVQIVTSERVTSKNADIISVANTVLYPADLLDQQVNETLQMLRKKAEKSGLAAVTGVNLVPVYDSSRNVTLLVAYGTAIFEQET